MFNSVPKSASSFTITSTTPTTNFTFGGSGDKLQSTKPQLVPHASLVSLPSTAQGLGFSYGNIPTPSSGASLGFSATPTSNTSTLANQLSFGSTPTTVTKSLISAISSSASSTGFHLGSNTAAPTPLTSGLSATNTSTTFSSKISFPQIPSSVVSASIVPISTSALVTFNQLEDQINKWTIDLEEQGRHFINQAKQLNAWDNLLIQNGQHVKTLNNSIERVKLQQQQLDQELDFILAQQKDLEELLVPLEKELANIPQSTDQERNRIYQQAESMDSQMKQMAEDLKSIIEYLNETNKEEDSNDAVTQISRILNAHMNSLQWTDRQIAQISSYLEQIAKMQDLNRRNNVSDIK